MKVFPLLSYCAVWGIWHYGGGSILFLLLAVDPQFPLIPSRPEVGKPDLDCGPQWSAGGGDRSEAESVLGIQLISENHVL